MPFKTKQKKKKEFRELPLKTTMILTLGHVELTSKTTLIFGPSCIMTSKVNAAINEDFVPGDDKSRT